MYYIMPQRIDMRLTSRSALVKRPRTNIVNTNTNTMLQSTHQRLSSFGGNVFTGNMNDVFATRGRTSG